MKKLHYRVLYKLGDHVDTDVLTPGKYLISFEPEYLATICLKDTCPDFRKRIAPGGVLVAGKNFGCGSSRETAPIALQAAGTKTIIAEEFARIFYRNAINIGIPCFTVKEATKHFDEGDDLEIELTTGVIKNLTKGNDIMSNPVSEDLIRILETGGLVPYLKKNLRVSGHES